jgi:hypothetical protein
MPDRLIILFEWILFVFFLGNLLSYSTPPPTDINQQARTYTRAIEFDYVEWMLDAFKIKAQQGAAGLPGYLDRETRKQIVMEYLRVTRQILEGEYALQRILADASIADKDAAAAALRAELEDNYARQTQLAPLAEAILQEQITQALSDLGLTTLGQPMPSVLYHSTPVPNALIVSRRDVIEQIANISIDPGLTVDEQALLESRVDEKLDAASLVVPIGGVGVYPTMVMQTTSLDWLVNTIAHEWMHNYLTWHALGLNYGTTPELRTMNETTASIAGNEVGTYVIEHFYPELLTSSPGNPGLVSFPLDHPDPGGLPRPPFDFRAEMHLTRVTADALLAGGKIEEAEAYMIERQQFFLRNGYLLRKLNQAYFAFYGAYADVPGGAAGEDPVGPAVRALRERSASLADFIHRIALMDSFEDLQKALAAP